MNIKDTSILWIMPELNHYRIKTFNYLSKEVKKLVIIKGSVLKKEGHNVHEEKNLFKSIETKGNYRNYSLKFDSYYTILRTIQVEEPDILVMPLEKKFIFLIYYVYFLKLLFGFKLISYNHDFRKYTNANFKSIFNRIVYKFLILFYDRIIFYTENGMKISIDEKFIKKEKAGFANNTIDTKYILNNFYKNRKSYDTIKLVFIGRIVSKRKLEDAINYFLEISRLIKETKFFIVGDGPLKSFLKNKYTHNNIIFIDGTTVEAEVEEVLNEATLCLNPGSTGLSILHCFSYGIPVVTIKSVNQPPEIDYLLHNYNGIILEEENNKKNLELLVNLLKNNDLLKYLSKKAVDTANKYTIEHWVYEFKNNLLYI
jgi:glycosyltransferase involved in cell wall biosynthesis